MEEEEEETVEGELSWGNSRVREKLEEDHDEVQCCEHVEVEMQCAELVENVIDLPANQPSVHHVNIPSLAKEDAILSKLALVLSMITPERPPNFAYHFSFSAKRKSESLEIRTSSFPREKKRSKKALPFSSEWQKKKLILRRLPREDENEYATGKEEGVKEPGNVDDQNDIIIS